MNLRAHARQALPRCLLFTLSDLAFLKSRDGLTLLRVSLSFPDSELPHALSHAQRFADDLAVEDPDRTGALLVLDLSPKPKRGHFFGLAITRRSASELDRLWRDITSARITAKLRYTVLLVSGQECDWEHPSRWFKTNVRRVARYALKPLPRGHRDDELVTVSTGPLAGSWVGATALPVGRRCTRGPCVAPVPISKRVDARFCSDTCRKAFGKTQPRKRPA